MKIALCLYGMSAMDCLKHAKPNVSKDVSRKHWMKYMIEPNDMDVFMHCWSPDYENDYVQDFGSHVKNHLFEEKKKWPERRGHKRIVDYGNSLDEIMQSVHYSLKHSIDMKTKYEEENEFEYDLVMIARMDVIWFNHGNHKLSELNLNPELIYTSPWNYAFDKTKNRNMNYIFDHYMVTGSKMAIKISEIFHNIQEYVQYSTPQVMKYQYFKDIEVLDKVQPNLFYRFYDHILYRWLYYPWKYLFKGGGNIPLTDEWKGLKERREILLKQILE